MASSPQRPGKFRLFVSYYRPRMGLFLADLCCAFIVAAADLFYPVVTGNIIDRYIPEGNLRLLCVWCAALVGIYLLKAALNWFMQFYGHMVGVGMQADMRRDLFAHLQTLPFSYFDENKTGSIMSRIVNDLMEISELAHHGPEDLFTSFVTLIGGFILMCRLNIPLTLIIFAFLPLLLLFTAKMRMQMNRAFARRREEISGINATIENSISGIRVSKAFQNDRAELCKFMHANDLFREACRMSYRAMANFFSGMEFLTNMILVVVLLAGGWFAISGRITPGQFASYIAFVNIFFNPIRRLIQFVEQFQSGMSGFERFYHVMGLEPEQDSPGAVEAKNVRGNLSFCDVDFTYADDSNQILHRLNLDIPAGQTVALVGPSGGGKTTLCHLIPRFYEISGGSILLDGRDTREYTRASLRASIGIVQQEVFLFTGTIRDNIAYGKPDATEEEIVAAAKRANIHDTICSLENGYDTYIGEHGLKLSGGQRQRISIARVFLKNPPILILDEATSALDNATERLIQASLDELCRGRTTLVVAHRLSTIRGAQNIVVLTDEGIREQGTHEELLEKGGLYAELYQSQFRS